MVWLQKRLIWCAKEVKELHSQGFYRESRFPLEFDPNSKRTQVTPALHVSLLPSEIITGLFALSNSLAERHTQTKGSIST
jgi:hypothetical protein